MTIFWNDLKKIVILKSHDISLDKLDSRTSERILPLITIPIVCVFGVITNGLNIAVFLNPKMKDPTFKYMLAISISNFLYTGLLSYGYIVYCDECSLNKSYGTQVFKIIVNNYITSSLAIFSNLVEIYISIQRYFILTNKNNLQTISHKLVLSVLFIISTLYYINVLFCYDIVKNEYIYNSTVIGTAYSTVLSNYSKSDHGKAITLSFVTMRIVLSTVVLPATNIINLFHFRNIFKKKIEIKIKFNSKSSRTFLKGKEDQDGVNLELKEFAESQASRNMTLLVIWTCALYIFGATPRNVYIIIKYCLESSFRYHNFSLITFLILIFSHAINIFIYYSYNTVFRKIIKDYLKCNTKRHRESLKGFV